MPMTDAPAKPVLLTGASGALGRVLTQVAVRRGLDLAPDRHRAFPDPVPAGAPRSPAPI